MNTSNLINWKMSDTINAAIIAGLFALVTALINIYLNQPPQPPTGQINIPKGGETIQNPIRITGSLENIPEESHVWLAVEKEGLLWFKEPEIHNLDNKWNMTITEAGQSEDIFSLTLLMVSEDGNRFIHDWFTEGEKNNHRYPGKTIKEIPPEAKRLDIADNLKLR